MKASIQDEGSIVLVRPLDADALAWFSDNVSEDAQWFAGALVVEHRYVSDLLEGFESYGGEVQR